MGIYLFSVAIEENKCLRQKRDQRTQQTSIKRGVSQRRFNYFAFDTCLCSLITLPFSFCKTGVETIRALRTFIRCLWNMFVLIYRSIMRTQWHLWNFSDVSLHSYASMQYVISSEYISMTMKMWSWRFGQFFFLCSNK